MATTKDRLEQLINIERELHDHEVVAPEDIWGADAEEPPAAAGQGPAVTIPAHRCGRACSSRSPDVGRSSHR
jgi:hypothetical protein